MTNATPLVAQEQSSACTTSRVLIVDDERVNREILARMLKRSGYEVEVACDGNEALEKLHQWNPDLILLDVVMPSMDGLTCLQAIRKLHSMQELPVIMVTAEADRETIVGAFQSGANDYVTKPLDQEVALVRIANHIHFKKSQAALLRSEERFSLAVKGANAGIWDWDLQSGSVYFSPRGKRMLGFTDDEFPSTIDCWFKQMHPEDVASLCAFIYRQDATQEASLECELRIKHRDGNYRWMLCTGTIQRDQKGNTKRVAGSLADITEGKVRDGLTSLPNRLLFKDRLEQAIHRERDDNDDLFVVMFLDLDNFKLINDSLGHHVGDRLIVHVAKRLEGCLRAGDSVHLPGVPNTVARHGGDEFTILLDRVKRLEDAQRIAERIIAVVSEPYSLSGHEVCVGVSIGLALGGKNGKTADDLLREADTAMYYAKGSGRGQHRLFDPEMQSRASARVKLEKDLRQAVREEDQFSLLYQPIVRLSNNQIEGFEALIRWQHPRNEQIGPQTFIPVAEELGLIGPIGHWVFREACRQAAQWKREFPELPSLAVNVNCSAREVVLDTFFENVRKAISDSGVSPSTIKIELTESAVMKDPDKTGPLLRELQSMGFRIGIDDFGTGYSSLAYLHRLPLDVLKIDRSFVNNMEGCAESLEIVRTILMLGRSLHLDIVAEGIETETQRQMLVDMGCTHGQGYLFSRPVSAADAKKLLAKDAQRLQAILPPFADISNLPRLDTLVPQ